MELPVPTHLQRFLIPVGDENSDIEECVSYDDSFSEGDWIDGFECIAFSLSCKECGYVNDEWAALETM